MENKYNMRSPAVKRLMREAQEFNEATDDFFAQPLDDNLFEWHFTVRGPQDSAFEGGLYHGRIILPPEYPMKPPSIILLTPNGRFEVNKKICLSISGYHPESWQPSWSIRTALLAIIGFMPTAGNGAIGSLDYTPLERKKLAANSLRWKCPVCGPIDNLLPKHSNGKSNTSQEAIEFARQISFKGEVEKPADDKAPKPAASPPSPFEGLSTPGRVSLGHIMDNQTCVSLQNAPDTSTVASLSHFPVTVGMNYNSKHGPMSIPAAAGSSVPNPLDAAVMPEVDYSSLPNKLNPRADNEIGNGARKRRSESAVAAEGGDAMSARTPFASTSISTSSSNDYQFSLFRMLLIAILIIAILGLLVRRCWF